MSDGNLSEEGMVEIYTSNRNIAAAFRRREIGLLNHLSAVQKKDEMDCTCFVMRQGNSQPLGG